MAVYVACTGRYMSWRFDIGEYRNLGGFANPLLPIATIYPPSLLKAKYLSNNASRYIVRYRKFGLKTDCQPANTPYNKAYMSMPQMNHCCCNNPFTTPLTHSLKNNAVCNLLYFFESGVSTSENDLYFSVAPRHIRRALCAITKKWKNIYKY